MMSKPRLKWHGIAAIILFVICVGIGTWLSQRKPLWNDEIYTQVSSIEHRSVKDTILGRNREGNNFPLFYLIQKGICYLTQYRFPLKWTGEWNISDPRSQVILRISSNVFMSLSIALIYYFFARYYSGWSGLYSLLVSFSSYMVWAYWAEARPYALWFFLTTGQSLLFLNIIRQEGFDSRSWRWLVVIHILLSLTIVFGIAQIFIISFLLWLFKERRWRRYFLLTFIPVGGSLVYCFYPLVGKYLVVNPGQLIYDNIPPDRLLIFVMYVIFLFFSYFSKGEKWIQRDISRSQREGRGYLALTVLMGVAALALLVVVHCRAVPERAGFMLSRRYFIFLAPVGIIATTLFSIDLIRALKGRIWMVANIAVVLGGLLIIRILRTCVDVVALRMY